MRHDFDRPVACIAESFEAVGVQVCDLLARRDLGSGAVVSCAAWRHEREQPGKRGGDQLRAWHGGPRGGAELSSASTNHGSHRSSSSHQLSTVRAGVAWRSPILTSAPRPITRIAQPWTSKLSWSAIASAKVPLHGDCCAPMSGAVAGRAVPKKSLPPLFWMTAPVFIAVEPAPSL